MSDQVNDCRGVPIEPGDLVVTSGALHFLRERTVKTIERPRVGPPIVRFVEGSGTDPDRVAVVEKQGATWR